MKQRPSIFLLLLLAIIVHIGCGEKEDKNILEARATIASDDYAAAAKAVQAALSSHPDSAEAKAMQTLLQLRSGSGWDTSVERWHTTIQNVVNALQPLEAEIADLESREDPDSDELDRLEQVIRARNSAAGLLANALAAAVAQNANLLSELANQPNSRVILALLEAERCFDPKPRQAAEMLVQQIGNTPASVRQLTDLVQSTEVNTDIRRLAVKHLGYFEDASLIPVFESILQRKNESPDVLYRVITALEALKSHDIEPTLRVATRTNAGLVRMYAARMIGQRRDVGAIPDLIYLLADADSYVKNRAIAALVELGEASIAPLIQVLDSGARNVLPDADADFLAEYQYVANVYIDPGRLRTRRLSAQAAALQTLGSLKAKAAIGRMIDLLRDDDLKGSAAAALTAMKGAAVPDLLPALESDDDEIRIQVAAVLADIADRRSIAPLIQALTRPEERKEAKASAAEALGNMWARGENNSGVEALIAALDLDDTTAANAADALGTIEITTEAAVKKLIALAIDKRGRETVRSAALSTLAALTPLEAAQPLLLLMLSDDTSPTIRKAAVNALGEIKAPESVPVLLWALETRYDDIKDFQRHMKRKYKTLPALKAAIDALNVQWTGEYLQADYRSWSELKPIPSLVRSEVAVALGKIGGEQVVKPLIEALAEDERAAVRRSAAWALGEIKGDAVIDPIIKALKDDEQGVVRQEAAEALRKIGGDKVVAPLLTALKEDKFETTRKRAAIALRELNQQLADEGLVDVLEKGLGPFEEKREVQSVHNEVIASLVKHGNTTTAKYIQEALESAEDEWTRWNLVNTLGILEGKDKAFVPLLIEETKHASYVVRKSAVAALGGYKDRQAVDRLIAILGDGQEYKSIRAAAAMSLGSLRDERAAESLLAALDDENAEIRAQAANALGDLKDVTAVDKLMALFENRLEDAWVRAESIAALGKIGATQAEPALLRVLASENDTLRDNAMTALGQLKSVQAVPTLITILTDRGEELAQTEWGSNASTRVKAAYALADIGDPRAAEHIAALLVDDAEYDVALKDGLKRNWGWERFVAASRSFRLPGFVAPSMIARTEDAWEDWPVKAHALLALGSCDSPLALPTLTERLSDPTAPIRQYTALGAGEAGTSALLTALVKISKGETEENKDVRRAATQALGEIADPSTVPDLIAVMNEDTNHIEIRRDAAFALGQIGNDEAVSALLEKLQSLQASKSSKGLRRDIMRGLIEAKDAKAESVLKLVLTDEDADLHFWAAQALFKTTGDAQGYNWKG